MEPHRMDTPSAIVANVALLGMLPLHWIDPTSGIARSRPLASSPFPLFSSITKKQRHFVRAAISLEIELTDRSADALR